ncbi:MAG: hypothetical protein KF721_13230 [Ignavibacteriaceae bacterium]|nr:hypothetical protein [Ignavibacteriaceae bacterium]
MLDNILKMSKYDKWANQRVLDRILVDKPKEEKIVSLFSHILKAEDVWLKRILNIEPETQNFNLPFVIDELQNCLNEVSSLADNFILSLTEEKLTNLIEYSNLQGKKFSNRISDILIHVFNHATYHRGQIAQLFRKEELRAPITDYIVFIREKSK